MSDGLTTSLTETSYAPVLTRESINGSDADVVDANVDVVNRMYAELLDVEEIAPAALGSYYVDFYLTQSLGGGFAQYVFTAPEREDITLLALQGFFRCVRTGEKPLVGVREGRDATLVGLLVRKAVYDKRVVTMDEVLKGKADKP